MIAAGVRRAPCPRRRFLRGAPAAVRSRPADRNGRRLPRAGGASSSTDDGGDRVGVLGCGRRRRSMPTSAIRCCSPSSRASGPRNVVLPPGAADTLPAVTMIIPAHNERRRIEAKLRNTRALEYPAGRLEVLFVSDGSTDGTAEVIRDQLDERTQLHELQGRGGKAAALNAGTSAGGSRHHRVLRRVDPAGAGCRAEHRAAVQCGRGRLRFGRGPDCRGRG